MLISINVTNRRYCQLAAKTGTKLMRIQPLINNIAQQDPNASLGLSTDCRPAYSNVRAGNPRNISFSAPGLLAAGADREGCYNVASNCVDQ